MTPEQQKQFDILNDSGYSYYSEVRGNIIMTRPTGYRGPDSNRVEINGVGTISNYTGEKPYGT